MTLASMMARQQRARAESAGTRYRTLTDALAPFPEVGTHREATDRFEQDVVSKLWGKRRGETGGVFKPLVRKTVSQLLPDKVWAAVRTTLSSSAKVQQKNGAEEKAGPAQELRMQLTKLPTGTEVARATPQLYASNLWRKVMVEARHEESPAERVQHMSRVGEWLKEFTQLAEGWTVGGGVAMVPDALEALAHYVLEAVNATTRPGGDLRVELKKALCSYRNLRDAATLKNVKRGLHTAAMREVSSVAAIHVMEWASFPLHIWTPCPNKTVLTLLTQRFAEAWPRVLGPGKEEEEEEEEEEEDEE